MTHTAEVIAVGGDHPYDIRIEAGALTGIADALPTVATQVMVVSDEHVAALYAPGVVDALRAAGHTVHLHVFPAGEASKHLATFEGVIQALATAGCRRDACIVALGGGVVGDLAGFAAACWMRGIAFVQVPTSLLAMVDSSVGGKTGVDLPAGKNLIGAFHFPRAVVIDPTLLATLPARERAAGFAEVVKYGALGDAAFFDWLEDRASALASLDPTALVQAIAHSCRMKAALVERDPFERGERALLNFGHTFGHAIEAGQGFGGLNHGEAVAVGMCLAARLSESVCGSDPRHSARLARLLAAFDLPTSLPAGLAPADLLARMRLDKKAHRDGLRFILWDGIGRARVVDGVEDTRVMAVLATG